MIHEMRVYDCMPGRVQDLLDRFKTITLPLWDKHGIQQVGFWTTVIGESSSDLIYLLVWQSLAEREAKWTAFVTDPEWVAAKAQTESNGPLVSTIRNAILQPTAFSALR